MRRRVAVLALLLAPLLGSVCASSNGIPQPDTYGAESNAQAAEQEAAEDAWEDANR